METLIFIIWFGAYVIIHMFFTQIIYSKNLMQFCILISILLCVPVFLLSEKSERVDALKTASIFFWYSMLLFIIKLSYQICNNFLIKRKLLNKQFAGKGFTFVNYSDTVGVDDSWDEKLATKPSWLDSVLSLLLFILPLLIVSLLS